MSGARIGDDLHDRERDGATELVRPHPGLHRRLPGLLEAARPRDSLRILAVAAFCVLVWILRRPEQLTRPYVWVEESFIVRNFLDDGWAGAFETIQGYLILPANVLVALATEISFLQLPELMYAFALAVFVATVLLLLLPVSRWGDLTTRSAMASSMVLVPTNPEVFGVLLYSFWWTTLWPLIILGWKRDLWALRVPLLVIGTLSSPAAGALFVVFALAYLLNRRIRELISAAILLAGFVFQVVLALDSTRAELLSRDADPVEVLEQTVRTGGLFEARWLSPGNPDRYFLLLAGLAFLSFLVFAAFRLSIVARRHEALLLLAAAGVFTGLSAVPVPLISDPAGGAPRYYFLPFVAFGWVLLALWRYADVGRLRVAAGALLCLSLLGLATTFSRTTEATAANLSWEAEVRKCAASFESIHQIPIYFDGSTKLFWYLTLNPAECRRLTNAYSPSG
jgi:hypothetical protein